MVIHVHDVVCSKQWTVPHAHQVMCLTGKARDTPFRVCDGRERWVCAQVTYFEFSNESFNNAYNGQATANQYAAAIAAWAPMLKKILPNMKIGANGPAPIRLRRPCGPVSEHRRVVVARGTPLLHNSSGHPASPVVPFRRCMLVPLVLRAQRHMECLPHGWATKKWFQGW